MFIASGRYQRGSSLLLESCIVVACLGALCCWLMPGLSSITQAHRAQQFIEQLEQSIQLGKNEALSLQRPMVLCGSTDGQTCSADADKPLQYWLLAEYDPNNAQKKPYQVKRLLHLWSIPKQHTLNFKAFGQTTKTPTQMLIIQPNGLTYNNGTFTYRYVDAEKWHETMIRVNNGLRSYQEQNSGLLRH
ncbi:MAG: type 4 fimbrial biosis protein FimT [Pseudomonadota bacterium]